MPYCGAPSPSLPSFSPREASPRWFGRREGEEGGGSSINLGLKRGGKVVGPRPCVYLSSGEGEGAKYVRMRIRTIAKRKSSQVSSHYGRKIYSWSSPLVEYSDSTLQEKNPNSIL